jgi:hypothetical protein
MDMVREGIENIILPDTENVDELWIYLKGKVINILNRYIPRTKIRNKRNPPWIDDDVIRLSKSKYTKHKKAKDSNDKQDWENYKAVRNRLKNLVNSKYKDYISNLGSNLIDNPKRFWSLLNSRTKSKGSPTKIEHNGIETSDPVSMANVINDYFCSIFTKWENKTHPDVYKFINDDLKLFELSVAEIEKALRSLNPTKAPGPDGIPTKILKDCATELAPKFQSLFNTSLRTGRVPEEWKRANVVALHKKGKKIDPSNYRPISLLPVCSKVLERCIYNHIIDEIRPIISDYQHGFLSNSSTNSQLITFFDEINKILDNKGETDVIYFDLSKAFDSVPHPPLLEKIQNFGINGNLLNWFQDYLKDRKQRVIIDGQASTWLPVSSGVPQGSILGPLLFLMYINDLPDHLSEDTMCGMFADDTKIARHIKNPEDSVSLQHDIDAMSNWGDSWGLKFNVKKCKHLPICLHLSDNTNKYTLNGTILDTVDNMIDLGVTVTNDLKWTDHITTMCKKAEGRLWLIIRTLGFHSPIIAKKTAYIALIRSILEYSSPIWNPKYKILQKTIEDIQRKATNYILNNERYDHPSHIDYKTRLLMLDLLPTSYRREILDLSLMLKSINGQTNLHLNTNIKFVERPGIQTRQLTQATKLETTKYNLERTSHFYTQRVVEVWNSLPDHIRLALKNTKDPLVIKQHLIPHYKNKLHTQFDPDNQCTWVSNCKCNRC